MKDREEFKAMLDGIAEAASSAAVAEEEGSGEDVDYWEKETERRIDAVLDAIFQS